MVQTHHTIPHGTERVAKAVKHDELWTKIAPSQVDMEGQESDSSVGSSVGPLKMRLVSSHLALERMNVNCPLMIKSIAIPMHVTCILRGHSPADIHQPHPFITHARTTAQKSFMRIRERVSMS